MAMPSWKVSGQYYETCSCDFVCPCILGADGGRTEQGSCTFAMAFQIERGAFGQVALDGLGFIVLGRTPEAMANGNWSVGVVVDDRATAEQRDAIIAIVSGSAGGPMAVLSGLIGTFLGVESAPIRFDQSGVKWSVKASTLVDMGAEGAMGLNPSATEPLHIGNTGHPANDRLALCHASRSHVNALRLDLGRRQRPEQRPLRAVCLAGGLEKPARCVSRLSSAFISSSAPQSPPRSRGSSGTTRARRRARPAAGRMGSCAASPLQALGRLQLAAGRLWPAVTYRFLLAVTCTLQVYLYALNVVSNLSWGRNMTAHLVSAFAPTVWSGREPFPVGARRHQRVRVGTLALMAAALLWPFASAAPGRDGPPVPRAGWRCRRWQLRAGRWRCSSAPRSPGASRAATTCSGSTN